MSCNQGTPNVNKTFIIEPQSLTGGTPTLSACTTMYTNLLESCSGDTSIQLSTGMVAFNSNVSGVSGFTANTIETSIYYSGGTDLLDIFTSTDTFVTGGTFNDVGDSLSLVRNDGANVIITGITNFFVTGGTYNNNTNLIYFDRNDQLSAFTVDLSTIDVNDTFVSGGTLSGNTLVLNRNDNNSVNIDLTDIRFSGGSGNCIADLYVTNIYGCSPIRVNDPLIALSGITLSGAPSNDNTLTEIIARDTSTGELKYRDVSSIISAATPTDGNGITIGTGSTVNLGGGLTQQTTISGNSQNIDFGVSSSQLNFFNVNAVQGQREYSVPGQGFVALENPGGYTGTISIPASGVETKLGLDPSQVTLYSYSNSGTTKGQLLMSASGSIDFSSINSTSNNAFAITPTQTEMLLNNTSTGALTNLVYNPGYSQLDLSNTGLTSVLQTVFSPSTNQTVITDSTNNNSTTVTASNGFVDLGVTDTSTSQASELDLSKSTSRLRHVDGGSVTTQLLLTDNNAILNFSSGATTNGITINENSLLLNGAGGTSIELTRTGEAIFGDSRASGSTAGLEYSNNYHSGYSDRSLVDKEYVDNAITGVTLSGDNGITVSNNEIKLGGKLSQATTISGDTNNITFGVSSSQLGSFNINAIQGQREYSVPTQGFTVLENPGGYTGTISVPGSGLDGVISINPSTTQLYSRSNNGATKGDLTLHNNGLVQLVSVISGVTSNSGFQLGAGAGDEYIFVDGTSTPEGLKYAADYSVTYTNRSLVDKEYVDNAITGVSDTFTTGSTLVGSTLYFDTNSSLSAYTADLSPLLDNTNFYTTGSTLIGDTVYFDRTDTLSAYTLDLSSLDVNDTFITGMTFNPANYKITSTRNDGVSTTPIDLSILSADVTITGGTYDIDTGVVTFTNNSGGTFDVSGFTSGMTDSYTTAATISGNSITFDNNINGSNFYNVDLLPLLSGKTDVTLFNTYTGDTAIELANKVNTTLFNSHTGDTNNPHNVTIEQLSGVSETLFNTYTGDTATELANKVEDGANVGGANEVFSGKSGTTLVFRTLSGGTNTTVNTVGDVNVIDVAVPPSVNYYVTGGTVINNTMYLDRNDTLSAATIDISPIGTNYANMLYVDPNGNDSTGTKGNASLPFLTIIAAKAAASSGDTIVVNSGNYNESVLPDGNGLAKDGVDYYFMPNSVVEFDGTTPITLFNDAGFTNPIKVLGLGTFKRIGGGANTSGVFSITIAGAVIEGYEVTSMSSVAAIYLNFGSSKVTVKNRIYATGGVAVNAVGASSTLECPHIESTAGGAIVSNSYGGLTNFTVKANKIQGIGSGMSGGFTLIDCPNIVGSTYSLYIAEANVTTVINTKSLDSQLYISAVGSKIILNGWARNLYMANGNLKGGYIGQATIVGGNVDSEWKGTSAVGTHVLAMQGGKATFKMNEFPTVYGRLNQTGGDLTLIGDNENNGVGYYLPSNINGATAKLRLMGFFKLSNTPYIFNLIDGTLDLGGSRLELSETGSTTFNNSIIKYDGGTIISNGARLITGTNEQAPIEATNTGLNIKVLAGGLSTNTTKNILSARKLKYKLTVSSVATTSVTVNATTFTESDTATYNTVQLLAERLKDLVNLGAEPVTATYTASNDYFEIEADVAGTAWNLAAFTNLTSAIVRANGQAMTNTTGGSIIQDVDVE